MKIVSDFFKLECLQLDGQTSGGVQSTWIFLPISECSPQSTALGQWGWAFLDYRRLNSTAFGLVLAAFVSPRINRARSYIKLWVWCSKTNCIPYYPDMPHTSGTHRILWSDSFGWRLTMLAKCHHCQHLIGAAQHPPASEWIPFEKKKT